MMMRILLVVVALVIAGCGKKEKEAKKEAAPAAPSALPAVQAIYADYVAAPTKFDRVPHLSRFYVDDNVRKDAACARGEAGCLGDRFACLETPPTKPGQLLEAKLDGEAPGVSATIKLKLRFGGKDTDLDADAVFEDGKWKIDQVRCPGRPQ